MRDAEDRQLAAPQANVIPQIIGLLKGKLDSLEDTKPRHIIQDERLDAALKPKSRFLSHAIKGVSNISNISNVGRPNDLSIGFTSVKSGNNQIIYYTLTKIISQIHNYINFSSLKSRIP